MIVVALFAVLSAKGVEARNFYIDFDDGSDQSDGESADHAWKHAPGDLNAEGVARQQLLRGGDRVLFKGGVDYRGSIHVARNGPADQTIRYLGADWGPGRATISGYDRYTLPVESCIENQACPVGFRKAGLVTVKLPIKIGYENQILFDNQSLKLAESSASVKKEGAPDDIDTFFKLSRGQIEQNGDTVTIESPEINRALGESPGFDVTGFVWGLPNMIFYPTAADYDSATGKLKLTVKGFKPYDKLEMAFAIANHPRLIAREGEYATLEGGARLLIRTDSSYRNRQANVEVSQRDFGFNLSGPSNIEIDGFNFRGIVGGAQGGRGGSSVYNMSPARNIKISNNYVVDTGSFSRGAAMTLALIDGLVVKGNTITRHRIGAGIRLGSTTNATIEGNVVSHLTWTGLSVMKCRNIRIRRNIISDVNGVHGNGMAIYLRNENIEVSNNTIVGSARPITFEGDNTGVSLKLVIARNLIRAEGPSTNGAIQDWGGRSTDVAILSNVILSEGGVGVELRRSATGIFIANNVLDGLNAAGIAPKDISIVDNGFFRNGAAYATVDGNWAADDLREAAKALFTNPSSAPSVFCVRLNGYPRMKSSAWRWSADIPEERLARARPAPQRTDGQSSRA